MKYSGVEWIGEIPDKWKLNKIGQLFNLRNEKVSDKDYSPLSVSKSGIVPQLENVAKSDASDDRKLVLKGDFAINSRSDRKMSCGVSPLDGSVSLINTILYPKNDNVIFNDYMNYLLKNYGFAEEFYRWGHGIVADLWTTKWQEMKSIMLPLPSVQKQKAIYDFLNQKTVEIDSLIEIENQQIEKLKEYKQAVITEAVTRGLDKDAPLKDSGVEWIGNIPSNWKIIRIKDAFLLNNERTKEVNLENVNLISLYTDRGVIQHSDLVETTGNRAISVEGYKLVRKNDIVVNIILCWMGAVGMSEYDGVTSPAYDVYNPKNNVVSKYYHYLFRTKKFSGECFKYGRGIMLMRWRTYSSEFTSINIPYPSTDEQNSIVQFLDKKCSEIDKLIEIKRQKINKLEEYKKSIIYEYVTGKKEVC